MRTKTTLRRAGRLLAPLALTLAVAAPVAQATPATDATTWIGGQLTGTPTPDHFDSFGSPDVGLTIDGNAAFYVAGATYASQQAATATWIESRTETYSGGGTCSGTPTGTLRAGAVAKLAYSAIINGRDPRRFGPSNRNLIADLECLQTAAGRYADQATPDYSNTFTQSLALLVLKKADPTYRNANGSTLATGASYLVASQCTRSPYVGAYRSELGGSTTACNNLPPYDPSRTPPDNANGVDVDSTGLAVGSLYAEGSRGSRTSAALAGVWLVGQASSSSSPARLWWRSYCDFANPTTSYASVNSTALAVMGYVELGIAITAAQNWLADTVNGGPDNGMPACTASGAGDVRATVQGIPALLGLSYADILGV